MKPRRLAVGSLACALLCLGLVFPASAQLDRDAWKRMTPEERRAVLRQGIEEDRSARLAAFPPVDYRSAVDREAETTDPIDKAITHGWVQLYSADYWSAAATWMQVLQQEIALINHALVGTGVTAGALYEDFGRLIEGELTIPARQPGEKNAELHARYREHSRTAYGVDIPQAALDELARMGKAYHGLGCAASQLGQWDKAEQYLEGAAHCGLTFDGLASPHAGNVLYGIEPLVQYRNTRRMNEILGAMERVQVIDQDGDVVFNVYADPGSPVLDSWIEKHDRIVRGFNRVRALYSGDDPEHLARFKPVLLGYNVIYLTDQERIEGVQRAMAPNHWGIGGDRYDRANSTYLTDDPARPVKDIAHSLLGHETMHRLVHAVYRTPREEGFAMLAQTFFAGASPADRLWYRAREPLSAYELMHFDFSVPNRAEAVTGYSHALLLEVSLLGIGNPETGADGFQCLRDSLYLGIPVTGGWAKRFEDAYGLTLEDAITRMLRMSDDELLECYDRVNEVVTRVSDRLCGGPAPEEPEEEEPEPEGRTFRRAAPSERIMDEGRMWAPGD